jgi:hypothetical protein
MPTRIEFDPADIAVRALTAAEDPAAVAQIVALFQEAAVEMAWQPGDQITAYLASSIYFAFEDSRQVQGAVQLVRGGTSEGMPVLKVWPELGAIRDFVARDSVASSRHGVAAYGLAHRTDVADVALVALKKEFRGKRHLYWALYAAMWRYCVRAGIGELWMEVPHEKLESYRGLGWPLTVEGPLRMQWEEPCYPCRVSVRGVGEAMIARARRCGTFDKTVEEEYRAAGAT